MICKHFIYKGDYCKIAEKRGYKQKCLVNGIIEKCKTAKKEEDEKVGDNTFTGVISGDSFCTIPNSELV